MKRAVVVVTAVLAAVGIANFAMPVRAQNAAVTKIQVADAQSAKIVVAANAFLGTLSETQKKAALFAYGDAQQRARWSNFPVGTVARAGVRWGDLNPSQRAALTELLGAVLSPAGVKMIKEQMDADDELKSNAGGGGGGRRGGGFGGGVNFGSDLYFVSFLGAPSTTKPWMLQFGGHHLAVNATVVGPNVAITPSLTGGQPTKYTKDGSAIYIVEREVRQANAFMASLTPAQRAKAVLGPRSIDLVLGPGHDGQTLQTEGLAGSAMSEAQKALFVALIEARVGVLNADDFASAMTDIRKNLNDTYFAWYGATEDAGSAYFRATGPTLVLEFAPQGLGGASSNHLHNMYRNPKNDYGAAWAAVN